MGFSRNKISDKYELEITGEIKLNDLFDVFEGEDETTLVGTDAEYYLFLLNDTE